MTFFISFVFIIVILTLIFERNTNYGCLGFVVIILIGIMVVSYSQKKAQEKHEEWRDEVYMDGVTNGEYADCVAEEERIRAHLYCDP